MDDIVNYEELVLRMQEDPNRYVKANSAYTLLFAGPVAAGAAANAAFRVDSGSMFVWTKGTYFVDIAGAAQTDATRVVPLATVQLTDSGSERQLFDIAQPVPNLFGTGQIPAILPVPYLFQKNAQMSGLLLNYDAASAYSNLYLTFLGYRVYDLRGG